ncbi:MAG: hypothetical protein FWF60_08740 [Oscillospiraceae bacterium]|nr:hypothetical protein [Oscillospiraceae bacterium]
MKRIFPWLLCLCFLMGFYACGNVAPGEPSHATQPVAETYPGFPSAPETFTGMREADLQPYFELAQEVYRRYILAAYFPGGTPELPQLPLQMTPPLRKYTELRFANDTRLHQDFPKALRSITTRMAEWQVIDGKLLCTPCVDVAFRYRDMDTDSAFGSGVQMLIEAPRSPTLVDWFDLDKESWDRQVREGHYNLPDGADPWAVRQWPVSWDLSDPENWLGSCPLKEPADKIFD